MTPRGKQLCRDASGAASIEFALVSLAFLSVILFILACGLVLWGKSTLQMVAAQTARCLALASADCADETSYAVGLLSTWGAAGIVPTVAVDVDLSATCNSTVGHFVSVTITATSGDPGSVSPSLAGLLLTATACHPTGA